MKLPNALTGTRHQILLLLWLGLPTQLIAGSFLFSGEPGRSNTITHPMGYTGSGTSLLLRVCIDGTSTAEVASRQGIFNAIETWNESEPSFGNLTTNASEVPPNHRDFESTILHELGHALGLHHPNLGAESCPASDPYCAHSDFTQSTAGTNTILEFGLGPDGEPGTSDDSRGDDGNLHWFFKDANNPFVGWEPVDSSTYLGAPNTSQAGTPLRPMPVETWRSSWDYRPLKP